MKQTAVEWSMQTLEQNNIVDLDVIDSDKYYTIIEQAKEIERKIIMDAYKEGCIDNILDESTDKVRAEQYYNETFKQD